MPIRRIQQPSHKLKQKYVQVTDTSFRHISKNIPGDRLFTEIGDTKQPDFKPQVKICRWGNSEDDNEVNFSARLVTKDGAVTEHDGKLAYDDGEQIARFYEVDTGDEDGGFEFDVVFNSRPKSDVTTWTIQHKELNFFYQPALTPEEIADGVERPENVVGSYAVYHKTKRNNKVGDKEYRTGKAFHIYRPYYEDANGERVWGELNIDTKKNEMTVTAPKGWLDTAAYPVVLDPTFGYTTAGASSQEAYGNQVFGDGSKPVGDDKTLSEAGDVSKLTAYVSAIPTATSVTIYGGIFGKGSTHPVERTGQSVSNSVSATGWHDMTYGTQPSLSADDHKLVAYLAAEGAVNYGYGSIAFDTGGSNSTAAFASGVINASQMADTITDDGSGNGPLYVYASVSGSNRVSIYATYTASGGGTESTLTVTNATLTLTGQSVTMTLNAALSVTAASLSLSGQSVGMNLVRNLAVTPATLSVAPQSVTMTLNASLSVTPATLTITGVAVNMTYQSAGCYILLEDGSFLLQENGGKLAQETCTPTLIVSPQTLILTPQPVTMTLNAVFTVTPATLTLTGQTVTLTLTKTLTVTPATLTLTGQSVTLTAASTMTVTAATLTLTPQSVTMTPTFTMTVTAATLTLTGQSVTMTYTPAIEEGTLVVLPATLTLTGQTVTMTLNLRLSVTEATLTLTGQSVTMNLNSVLSVTEASLTVSGQLVTLTFDEGQPTMYVLPASLALTPQEVFMCSTASPWTPQGKNAATLTATGKNSATWTVQTKSSKCPR